MSSGSGSSSRRSPPRGSSPSPTPTTSRTAETTTDANRASRDLLRESVRLINCAGSSARTAKLAIRSASYSLRPAPNLVCASSMSIGSAANCFRASSNYLSTLAPLPNSPIPGLFFTLHRSATWMCMGIRQLRAPMSPVTRAMRSTAALLTLAAASFEKAVVAGAKADSHRHKRDRTRSRSPRLATPSDGEATSNDSVAAQVAVALYDTPRAGASGVATPRAGASGVATPRAGASGVATPRAGASGVATPRAGTSGDATTQNAKSNLKFSHILIKHKNSRRPVDNEDKPVTRTKDQAMDLVIDIHEKISRDLITFADAAVAFSDCTSARHEGDIQSRFKRGRMQKSFQSAALALGPGKISDIIETNSGYHIIQRAQAGAAGESHRHRCHRTRSRSPRLATPNDGNAAPTDVKPRHSTTRHSTPRDAVARDGAGRGAKTRAGVVRDGAGLDAVARDDAGHDNVAQDTTEHDATPCNGASGDGASANGTPNDMSLQDAKSNLKFSHILIKHKDSRRPVDNEDKPMTRTKEQAMDLVIDIHEKISQHLVTFADAAVSFSDCASARHDGDIQSQFKSGRVQKSFEAAALALNPGQISHIIESNSGYHILLRRE